RLGPRCLARVDSRTRRQIARTVLSRRRLARRSLLALRADRLRLAPRPRWAGRFHRDRLLAGEEPRRARTDDADRPSPVPPLLRGPRPGARVYRSRSAQRALHG